MIARHMAYDAITIDSNSFIHAGIAFETGLLGQLKQFKDGPVDLILSEIVVREVLKHLLQMTKKERDAGLQAVRKLEQLGLIPDEDLTAFKATSAKLTDSREAARVRLGRFIIATGAETVAASLCAMDELFKLYFTASAPFVSTGDKKFEFPDAIALLSLEKWAEKGDKRVLAVSADKGWAAYAEGSARIDVKADLAEALETLQEHAEAAEAAVATFMKSVEEGQLPGAAKSIDDMLTGALENWTFAAEGNSVMHLENDSSMLRHGSYSLGDNKDDYDITIVRLGHDVAVARVGANFSAVAEAEFSLAAWDSIDKEYVGMGGASAETEVDFDGAFLLTLYGDLSGPAEDIEIGDVEIVEAVDSVDFGEVEFDPGEPDDLEDFLGGDHEEGGDDEEPPEGPVF